MHAERRHRMDPLTHANPRKGERDRLGCRLLRISEQCIGFASRDQSTLCVIATIAEALRTDHEPQRSALRRGRSAGSQHDLHHPHTAESGEDDLGQQRIH